MKGGYKSKTDTGPALPMPSTDADHGAQRLVKLIKNFPADGSEGTFLGEENYGVDRNNTKQPTPKPTLTSDGHQK